MSSRPAAIPGVPKRHRSVPPSTLTCIAPSASWAESLVRAATGIYRASSGAVGRAAQGNIMATRATRRNLRTRRIRRQRDLDHPERLVGLSGAEQRERDVVDRHPGAGPSLATAVVGMAMERSHHLESVERVLEPAGSQERVDLLRLTLDGFGDRRVMEQRDPRTAHEPRQRRLELQRFADRLVDEGLDDLLAPGLEHALAEPARESLDPREADAAHFGDVAVQHLDSRVLDQPSDLVLGAGVVVVVPEH